MKDDLSSIKESLAFPVKAVLLLIWVGIGFIGSLCTKLMRKQKITWRQVFASAGVALFVGFLATVICFKHRPEAAPYVVPACTYLADKIVLGLSNIDWKDIIQNLVKNFFGGK